MISYGRFVDNSLDSGEYLAVEIGNNGRYTEVLRWTDRDGDDDRWHHEIVDLSRYLQSGFNVRFVTEESSSSEDVGIDNVLIRGEGSVIDRTPPIISVPGDMALDATSENGRIVTYQASAYDAVDGTVSVTCSPQSGSNFAVGTTTVTCRANDSSGNTSTETFRVTVNAHTHDTDGDGFADSVDQCPSQASATNNGCPELIPIECFEGDDLTETGLVCAINDLLTGKVIAGEGIFITGQEYRQSGFVDVVSSATIGLVTTDSDGQFGLLTSSHWTSDTAVLNKGIPYVKNGLLLNSQSIGSVTQDTYVYANSTSLNADVAFVSITNPDVVPHTNQIQQGLSVFNITSFGGLYDLSRNTEVQISGLHNDGIGLLSFYNATVSMGSFTLIKQGLATYPSISGDSGAPIFIDLGNYDAQMIGMHVGKGCSILFADLSSVYYTPCDSSSPDSDVQYKVFTPWENIVQSLSLE